MTEDFTKYNGEGTVLRKAQLRMLDMLVEIDRICRKYNIPYSLEGGTLLGAVRHKGFIPWDDDTDIFVLKKDYKRFREAMIKELPEQFFFSDWTTDKYHFDNTARIKDTKSLFDYHLFAKQKVHGLHIDVYLFDYVPSKRARKIFNFFYRRMWRSLHHFDEAKGLPVWRRQINLIIAAASSPFIYGAQVLYRLAGRLSPHRKISYDYINNTYVYPEEYLFPLSEITFEGKKFFAPANPDGVLKIVYGDYMQFPPEEKRLTWHGVKIEVYE